MPTFWSRGQAKAKILALKLNETENHVMHNVLYCTA